MERDFAAYLFTLFSPLFTSGASFSIAREYSVRNLNVLTHTPTHPHTPTHMYAHIMTVIAMSTPPY